MSSIKKQQRPEVHALCERERIGLAPPSPKRVPSLG
jgi:hypothetical protein